MGFDDFTREHAKIPDLAITRNYSICKQACDYAIKTLSLGPANQGICYAIFKATNVAVFEAVFETEAHKELIKVRENYEQKFKERGLYNNVLTRVVRKEMLSLIAEYAKTARTGACGEYGAVVFEYLRTQHRGGTAFNLEFIKCRTPNDTGGHYVVVMNRDYGTDLTDPKKWNTTAYICDPWWGMVWTWNDLHGFPGFPYVPEASLSLPHNGTSWIPVSNWLNW